MQTDRDLSLKYPLAVFSDLHLGHPGSNVIPPKRMVELVGNAKTVVINGDAFEHLSCKRNHFAIEQMTALYQEFDRHGIRTILITGNHDTRSSTLTCLSLLGGRIIVTHGDSLHPQLAPWSREAPILRDERTRLQAGPIERLATLSDEMMMIKRMSLVASRYDSFRKAGSLAKLSMISKFAKKPIRILRVLRFWSKVPHFADLYHARYIPHSEFLIIGHTHRAGIWKRTGYTLINTGAHQPLARALMVHIDEETLTTYDVTKGRANKLARWNLG